MSNRTSDSSSPNQNKKQPRPSLSEANETVQQHFDEVLDRKHQALTSVMTRASRPLCDLTSLFYSGNYADFRIVCGNQKWDVHKAIVCLQSGYFRAKASSEYVVIDEDNPATVRSLILFLYKGEYPVYIPKLAERLADRAYEHIKFYSLGQKLEITNLRLLALVEFGEELKNSAVRPENFTSFLVQVLQRIYKRFSGEISGLSTFLAVHTAKVILENILQPQIYHDLALVLRTMPGFLLELQRVPGFSDWLEKGPKKRRLSFQTALEKEVSEARKTFRAKTGLSEEDQDVE